ncbi:MAG: purine-nucleoside phosphorylase [Ignavibacteriaceae bacterium]
MIDLNFKYKPIIDFLKGKLESKPSLVIVLGSGLGDFASELNLLSTVSADQIPGYPVSTVSGHSGKIHLAEYHKKSVLLFRGRIHFYEGYRLSECVLPVFIAYKLGCSNVLLTNAAGGININFKPGDFMLANSFNAIAIKKEITELFGIASPEIKNLFLDFPSGHLNNILRTAAANCGITLQEGVYWYSKGPVYETPAEVNYAKRFGADAVGMSTVHEAIAAAYFGMKVSSVSCITNFAAGISTEKLSHTDVTNTAETVKSSFGSIIKEFIRLI